MAIRNIREIGDGVLNKKCKEVKEMTPRTKELIEDMIDVTGEDPYVMVNPRILEVSGEQTGHEGCLSVPGKTGVVTRPNYVKAVAYNENMELYEVEGTELLARAICHEMDHLEGKLYVDMVEGRLMDVEELEDEEE